MKAMASQGATHPGAAAWRSREHGRAEGRAPAVLWLVLPGGGALALGAGLLAVAATDRVGLLLVAAGGGLVARRAVGVVRDRPRSSPRSSPRSLPARQTGAVPVGDQRVGRDAQGRVPGARDGQERERRAVDLRARVALPAARHAWRNR